MVSGRERNWCRDSRREKQTRRHAEKIYKDEFGLRTAMTEHSHTTMMRPPGTCPFGSDGADSLRSCRGHGKLLTRA